MITFDARAARALKAGDHLTFAEIPGLRLVATKAHCTWTYRYKSPVDGKMRQVRIGRWPATSAATAVVAWERLRDARSAGADPAAEEREARAEARARDLKAKRERASAVLTVARVVDDYLEGYHRGAVKHRRPTPSRRSARL